MGQKVHPTGIRLGIVKDWNSIWYADTGEYADQLNTDLRVRGFLRKKLSHASVSGSQKFVSFGCRWYCSSRWRGPTARCAGRKVRKMGTAW